MTSHIFSISDIERESGINRDTLRIWERRYGFPTPLRNERGERIYSDLQLLRLRLIKQLIDRGMQPGKLVNLEIQDLKLLIPQPDIENSVFPEVKNLINIIAAGLNSGLQPQLENLLQQRDLKSFLTDIVAPMNIAVGNAWFNGTIGILDEHHYAETVRSVLTVALSSLPIKEGTPRVLLTTLTGEQHAIGLLMVACMLRIEGVEAILLGVQTPLKEIVRGALDGDCRIVGLSCSEYMGRRIISSQLVKLRKLLPDDVTIWAGGSGVRTLGFLKDRIQLFNDLRQLHEAIQVFKKENSY